MHCNDGYRIQVLSLPSVATGIRRVCARHEVNIGTTAGYRLNASLLNSAPRIVHCRHGIAVKNTLRSALALVKRSTTRVDQVLEVRRKRGTRSTSYGPISSTCRSLPLQRPAALDATRLCGRSSPKCGSAEEIFCPRALLGQAALHHVPKRRNDNPQTPRNALLPQRVTGVCANYPNQQGTSSSHHPFERRSSGPDRRL